MVPARFLAVALIAACTPAAYAPPARLISLDSPTAPRGRGTDVQGEIGRIGTLWGPDLASGNIRARHGLSDNVVIEGETGVSQVENEGVVVTNPGLARTTGATVPVRTASDSRDAYTGRAGVILQGIDDKVRGALTAGVGGGYSPVAGGWTSIDIGASAGGTHRWIRPWFAGELGFNQPLSSRPFVVQYGDSDPEQAVLALTSNLMARGTFGLELGPVRRAVVLGLSVTRVYADTNGALDTNHEQSGGDAYVAVAAGFRAQL
jgi:hypothetical protein